MNRNTPFPPSTLATMLLTCLASIGVGLVEVPAAQAQDGNNPWANEEPSKVEKLSSLGTKAYRAGEYRKALGYFEEAYELEANPNLLYNMAKCQEKLGEYDAAIELYRTFLGTEGLSDEVLEKVADRINELKRIKEQLATKNSQETSSTEVASSDPEDKGDTTGQVTLEKKTPPPTDQGESNMAGIVTLSSGLALIGGGAVFGILARGQESTFSEAATFDEKSEARTTGRTFAYVADGMYVGGAIVTAIGIYLLASSGTDEQAPAAQSSLAPWVGPDGGGFQVSVDW